MISKRKLANLNGNVPHDERVGVNPTEGTTGSLTKRISQTIS